MRKIRIAFFAEILIKDFDGASRTMFQIIDRLPRDRFDIRFFCGVGPEGEFRHEVNTLPTLPIPFNATYKFAVPFFSKEEITKSLESFDPDVIHIASPSPLGHFALDFANRRSIPVISIYHTHFLSYIKYYLRHVPFITAPVEYLVSYSQKQFYNKCSRVLVPTKNIIKELEGFGFDTENMVLWQRGIDHQTFNPGKRVADYFADIVRNDRPNLLFVSRLVWEKNLDTLIGIYKLTEKRGYNLLIAGEGVAEQSLKRKMPKATFLGKLNHSELSKAYASADVFVFTSISETYGNVVVEAMASGLPCVIADGGGSASFIEHGKNGFLVSADEPEQYVEYIQKILSDDQLKEMFVANGLAYTRLLSWDALVQRYFDMVEQIAGEQVKSVA